MMAVHLLFLLKSPHPRKRRHQSFPIAEKKGKEKDIGAIRRGYIGSILGFYSSVPG